MSSPLNISTKGQHWSGYLPELPPLTSTVSPPITPPATPQVASMLVYVKDKARWEYKVLTRNLAKEQALMEAEVNALGEGGWELAGVVSDSPLVYFYFKRPVR